MDFDKVNMDVQLWEEARNYGACAYCGRVLSTSVYIPSLTSDWEWIAMANWHLPGCEWVATRGLQLPPVVGGTDTKGGTT